MLLKQKLQIGGILTLFLMVIIVAETYDNSKKLEDTSKATVHTQQILFENEDLFAALVDLETRSRGYAISGNEKYIQYYDQIHQKLFAQLVTFKKLIAADSILKEEEQQIESLIRIKADFSGKVISVTKMNGINSARLLISSGIGIKYMNDVRQVVLIIENKEKEILHQYLLENEKEVKWFHIGLISSLLAILIIMIIMLYIIKNSFQARLNAEERLKKKKLRIEQINQELTDSISYASRLQISMLSDENELNKVFPKSFSINMPKDIVSGDFFMVSEQEGKKFMAVADCTGHGVPGAFMSILGYTGLKKALSEYHSCHPSDILDSLNVFIKDNFHKSKNHVQDGMDIALFCLDEGHKMLTFAGANNLLWHITKDKFTVLKGDRQPIGNYSFSKPFTKQSISVEKGDCLFLFTDGIYDQFGGLKGKKLKQKGLKKLIESLHTLPMDEQKEKIMNFLKEWRGDAQQVDDICMVGIEIN